MASSTSPRQKLVIVYGIRRSGNHALIRWVMDCFEGVKLHLNDIHTKLADPYLCFLSGEVTNVSSYEIHRTHLGINRHLLEATTIQPRQKLSVFNPGLDRDALRSINKDLLLLSYEEVSFSNPRLTRFLEKPDKYVGPIDSALEIVLLRDPYNLFASLLKSGMMDESSSGYYVSKYKEYGDKYLKIKEASDRGALAVTYNEFVTSPEYRISMSNMLGGKLLAEAPASVSCYGGGSSFQPQASQANELDTMNRWKSYVNDPLYRSLFDAEITNLADEIFKMRNPL
mgnify:CR=1 FL=1